jgi:hypothetical protein
MRRTRQKDRALWAAIPVDHDQKTIEQLKLFVEKLRAQKTALHPEAK